MLQADVEATIATLAEKGLERCQSEDIASEAGSKPATDGAIPDLLKDPFLNMDPDQTGPAPGDVITTMPWLCSDEETWAMPTPDPTPTPAPVPNQETTATPTAIQTSSWQSGRSTPQQRNQAKKTPRQSPRAQDQSKCSPRKPVQTWRWRTRNQHSAKRSHPLETIEPEPQEPAATKLLEHSWLRVQLQPAMKSPTDSAEPMGLINRIKGVFARSVSR